MAQADVWQFPGYISLVVSFICATIMLSALVHLIRKTKSKLPQTAILISYITIIFYSLYAIHYFIFSIYAITTTKSTFNGYICYYGFFTPMYFITGKVFTFIFYVCRLYKTFNNTTFKYSKLPLQIFGVFICIGYYLSTSLFAYVTISGLSTADMSIIGEFSHCADAINYRSPTNLLLATIAIMLNLIVDLVVTVITLR